MLTYVWDKYTGCYQCSFKTKVTTYQSTLLHNPKKNPTDIFTAIKTTNYSNYSSGTSVYSDKVLGPLPTDAHSTQHEKLLNMGCVLSTKNITYLW
jgi:hypothetical protein